MKSFQTRENYSDAGKRKTQTDEIQKQLDKMADKRILVLVSDQRLTKRNYYHYQAVRR